MTKPLEISPQASEPTTLRQAVDQDGDRLARILAMLEEIATKLERITR